MHQVPRVYLLYKNALINQLNIINRKSQGSAVEISIKTKIPLFIGGK